MQHEVHIYTDGAAKGNPGPAGYGVVMEMVGTPYKKEFYEGFRISTNNRMELLAVIVALKHINNPQIPISVYTDSKYVCDAISKNWLGNWVKKGFKDVKNVDLWLEYLKVSKPFQIKFNWVKGHAGVPENERCDFLATQAAKNNAVNRDIEYEKIAK